MNTIGFKIELINNNIFKDAFESISRIVDEVKIEIDSEGFRVNALDRSHIVFVGLDLKPSVFDSFECEIPEVINVDTQEFMQILKREKKTDTLHLTLSDDISNSIMIQLIEESTRTFKIKLIDMEYETPQLPDLNPPSVIQMESSLLKDSLGDMELFSDVVVYTIDEEYFISSSNGEFGDSDFKYYHGENINGTVKSSFGIDKLKEILSASKFSPICEMQLGNDMPIILTFRLDTDDGELKFLLAPRLEEGED